MLTPTAVLTSYGIVTPDLVVQAAQAAKLELAAACALLEMESSGGRNVWGSDAVQTGGTYVKGTTVTPAAYRAYKARRSVIGAQGVGPCQLTSPDLQDAADAAGGCWLVQANLRVGFMHLAALVQNHGDHDGFRAYNGAGAAAETYATKAMALLATWRSRLAATEEENAVEWTDKAIPDYTKTPPAMLGADVTLGWMATHLGAPGAGQSSNVFAELAKVEAKLDAIVKKLGA